MSSPGTRMCVLLPCGGDLRWAVPQSCLAEILTLPTSDDVPPASVSWRGLDLPVVDMGAASGTPWRNAQGGTGLIVVVLGLSDEGGDCWGLALRGEGLAVRNVRETDCQDLPEPGGEYSLAAFELDGAVYQVPDLLSLQRLSGAGNAAISA